MTIGGTFWMGMNYWRKTHQELVKLQYTSVTPETIEDYYSEEAKKSAISLDVSVSDNDIARVATAIAQNFPANEREQYTEMYKQLYIRMEKFFLNFKKNILMESL